MSSTIYEPVRTPPPALGNSTASAPRAAKVLSGAGGASQSGIWVGIFAITMSFAAFTSALFVRQGSATDWTHIALPPILAGIVALALGMRRIVASRAAFRKSTFEATVTYWHFMGVLWLYLLLVLRTKL